jgi:ATP-dependent Clp protease ATP-binding subunit ClpA
VSELTPAASLAWKIAAAEAGAARHEFIELGHFVIGLLSLEKVVHDAPPDLALPQQVKDAVARENARLEELLQPLKLSQTALRRALRESLGLAAHDPQGRAISRSPALKTAFRRARTLAKGAPIDCLHLLSGVLEHDDPALQRAFNNVGARREELGARALAAASGGPQSAAAKEVDAMLRELSRGLLDEHGIALRITPQAVAFLADVTQPGLVDGGAKHAVERWVEAPLHEMLKSGKLRKHPTWQLVYDEGGVYLVPG